MANIIISPSRYVQGKGELNRAAEHLGALGESFFVIASPSGLKRFQSVVELSLIHISWFQRR